MLYRAKALPHICEANASFTRRKVYGILSLKAGAIMRDDKLSVQSMEHSLKFSFMVDQSVLNQLISELQDMIDM